MDIAPSKGTGEDSPVTNAMTPPGRFQRAVAEDGAKHGTEPQIKARFAMRPSTSSKMLSTEKRELFFCTRDLDRRARADELWR